MQMIIEKKVLTLKNILLELNNKKVDKKYIKGGSFYPELLAE